SFIAYLARNEPDAALKLRPSDTQALLRLTETHLNVLQAVDAAEPPPAPPARSTARDEVGDTSERLRIWSEVAKAIDSARRTSMGEPPTGTTMPLGASREPVTREDLRAWTELALSNDPLNARALRILGQIADAEGDEPRATNFMQAAATNSIREGMAVYWLMQKSFEKRDYERALYFADGLLRTYSQVMPLVMPTL